jgi:hypothetical protein
VLPEPRLTGEIGGGLARRDALADQRAYAFDLRRFEGLVQPSRQTFERNRERVQREPRRFVARVGRAVSERDFRAREPPFAFGEQRA